MIRDNTTPITYTRRLCAYMSDIGGIRAMVLREFGKAPSREQIASIRSEIIERRERASYVEKTKHDRAYVNGHEGRRRQVAA